MNISKNDSASPFSYDQFQRKINYLRISVTDRCNLRCVYCMPPEGVASIAHDKVLSFEKIIEFTRAAAELGFNKVRLTGGEPLVRKGVTFLVSQLSRIPEITDLSMTTNGILLDKFAEQLYEAGLQRLNISLDTMSSERYEEITRGGDIRQVLKGIITARKVGFHPIKLNCVVRESSSEKDARDVARFAKENNLEVRFIRKMNLSSGEYWSIEGGSGGECGLCNRLRLTSDGKIKPCLFSDEFIDISETSPYEAIKKAIRLKPEKGNVSQRNEFYNIGG